MATIYGSVRGIEVLRHHGIDNSNIGSVLVSFTVDDAYTAASDNGQLGGGGKFQGASTSLTMAQMIAETLRDGKTITLFDACMVAPGKAGSTLLYADTFAVATGNLTFEVCNSASTEQNAASGVTDRPYQIAVSYTAN